MPPLSADNRASLLNPRFLLPALLLILLTVIAYAPAFTAGFIWDDDSYIQRNQHLFKNLAGLLNIWIPGHTPQYYPVVFTTFWCEYHLWGFDPSGYHLTNILLHIANALLVWRIALRLHLPSTHTLSGAFLIAALFALHPINVESVAWATERKNVLSALFYLLALRSYILNFLQKPLSTGRGEGGGWSEGRSPRHGTLILLLFSLGLLSKSVVCSLPVILLLIHLWKRIPLRLPHLILIASLLLFGLLAGLHTAHYEHTFVGAQGEAFNFSLLDRFIIAARASCFYIWKILLPFPNIFIYPRWNLAPADPLNILPFIILALAVVMCSLLWFRVHMRGWRGPGIALAAYLATIFPALGFVNIYPMRYSFVADHFAYLATLPIFALIVATLAHLLAARARMLAPVLAALALATLTTLSFLHARAFTGLETLWQTTLSQNPSAFLAHNNLASLLLRKADVLLAQHAPPADIRAAIDESLQHSQETLAMRPNDFTAHTNAAAAYSLLNDESNAIFHLRAALAVKPQVPDTWWTLGRFLERQNNLSEARSSYREALHRADPHAAEHLPFPYELDCRLDLARLALHLNDDAEAESQYLAILSQQPENTSALGNLADIRTRQNNFIDARDLLTRALRVHLNPTEYVQLSVRLIRLLADCSDPAIRDPQRAIDLALALARATNNTDPNALQLLAHAYAQAQQFPAAQTTAEQALRAAQELRFTDLASKIQSDLAAYRNNSLPSTSPTTSPNP